MAGQHSRPADASRLEIPQKALYESVRELTERFEEHRAALALVQQKAATLSATVSSDRRVVTVTVGAQGQLTGLVLDDRESRRLSGQDLTKLILATAAKAQARVREQLAELAREAVPEGSRFADVAAGGFDPGKLLAGLGLGSSTAGL